MIISLYARARYGVQDTAIKIYGVSGITQFNLDLYYARLLAKTISLRAYNRTGHELICDWFNYIPARERWFA